MFFVRHNAHRIVRTYYVDKLLLKKSSRTHITVSDEKTPIL